MKRILALLLAAAILPGCANLTPEQNAAIGAALTGAAVIGGAYAGARYAPPQPVYVQPVYIAPRPRCWQSAVTGAWVC